FRTGDITDWSGFRQALFEAPEGSPRAFIQSKLGDSDAWNEPLDESAEARRLADLNRLLDQKDFFDPAAFESVLLAGWKVDRLLGETTDPQERARLERIKLAERMATENVNTLSTAKLQRRNRALLEAAFPEFVRPHVWQTQLRDWSDFAAVVGNPNLALLLSAAIAVGLYVTKRRPTKDEVSRQVETALMSAGVIILITAAGVAFGKMLEAAQVGPAIQQLFTTGDSGTSGIVWLVIGFTLAAVLKIAQGSSTAAMIIASSMLASTVGAGGLPFHTVYLATSIASGSLVGSWMNDSGFWVFTKMGGLTEAEGLKTWTPLLCVLGATGFAMTLLLATVMPLR
ncbi:MAG: Gnt-II system L-idonate transporter, partial [Planctomycetota bacterium]|nr:Gnt-II system L-idonate transporter [Planctomycetota bacterium]